VAQTSRADGAACHAGIRLFKRDHGGAWTGEPWAAHGRVKMGRVRVRTSAATRTPAIPDVTRAVVHRPSLVSRSCPSLHLRGSTPRREDELLIIQSIFWFNQNKRAADLQESIEEAL
jgi:hypothetical protein